MRGLLRVAVVAMTAGVGSLVAVPVASAVTVVDIGSAVIDAKFPGRVRVDVSYTCDVMDGARSMNVSVEQTDPGDTSSVAFGSSRVAPTAIVCDGTAKIQTVVVQSKTVNWIPDADAVVVTALSDIGSVPPANADAKKLLLKVAAAPAT
ncbi:hypothetical protein FB465_0216 [Kitasatospora atroaurantiaca]|uniref:Secreted protein n=2 Tax=Kitasatospora atroaurantiaca TaxID=285545 RepID=A0A561EI88_9ACTN|nr:hypothetical protein FB465_0216 [Kitasatospora atroaurantiaca]